jgi:hypothetical protein
MAGNHGDQLLVAVVQVVERAAVSRIDLIQRAAEPFAPSQHTNPHGAALQRRLGALVLPEGSNRFGVARAVIEHTAPTTADRSLTTSHKPILQRDTHPPPLSHGCGRPQRFRRGARSGRSGGVRPADRIAPALSRMRSSAPAQTTCSRLVRSSRALARQRNDRVAPDAIARHLGRDGALPCLLRVWNTSCRRLDRRLPAEVVRSIPILV